MNDDRAKQDLQYIRGMLEKSRRATAESGWQFIFWGILILVALAVDYLLIRLKMYKWIWAGWIFFMTTGVVVTIVLGWKQRRARGLMTYTQCAARHFVMACGAGFMLTGIVFPLLKIYSVNVIPIMVAMTAGILLFGLSGIYESGMLRWFGLLWWLGAVAMIPVKETDRSFVFIPLMIVGYLVPGFIFRSKYRRTRDARDS